jgi:hypothetical protein
MEHLSWSRLEKTVARAAFDAALAREVAAIRAEAEAILERSADPDAVWRVHDFLTDRRRAIERKYDYRYSVLISVFGRLLHEGWIGEAELAGLAPEKLALIRRSAEVSR